MPIKVKLPELKPLSDSLVLPTFPTLYLLQSVVCTFTILLVRWYVGWLWNDNRFVVWSSLVVLNWLLANLVSYAAFAIPLPCSFFLDLICFDTNDRLVGRNVLSKKKKGFCRIVLRKDNIHCIGKINTRKNNNIKLQFFMNLLDSGLVS